MSKPNEVYDAIMTQDFTFDKYFLRQDEWVKVRPHESMTNVYYIFLRGQWLERDLLDNTPQLFRIIAEKAA